MQLIPQSTATAAYRRLYFTTVDPTDLQSRVTGALAGGAYRISKNGAADAACTNSPVEVDAADMPGVRYIDLEASEVDTLGIVIVRISATGVEPREISAMVISATAFNPFAAVQNANTTQWEGAAVATPSVAGVPEVDLTHWIGVAPDALDVVTGSQAGGNHSLVPTRTPNPPLGMQILRVSQSDSSLRRIWFYLHDHSNKPIVGATWSSTGLTDNTYWLWIVKNGTASAEAAGTVSQVDGTMFPGLYQYTATLGELSDVGGMALQPYINRLVA